MKKVCRSTSKSKLPVFFEDRFFNRSVERGIAVGIILNPEGWMKPAGKLFLRISKEFSDFSYQMKYPTKHDSVRT